MNAPTPRDIELAMNVSLSGQVFNVRAQRARISAGWPHDSAHFHFARQHDSHAPFVEPHSANRFADLLIGVVSAVGLVVMVLVGL